MMHNTLFESPKPCKLFMLCLDKSVKTLLSHVTMAQSTPIYMVRKYSVRECTCFVTAVAYKQNKEVKRIECCKILKEFVESKSEWLITDFQVS